MQDKYADITLALAGLMQAVALVKEITQTGKVHHDAAFETCIHSILQTDAPNTAAVFGGIEGVKLGLEKLIYAFSSHGALDRSQSRYIMSLIHLQKKVSRSPQTLNTLSRRILQTKKQVEYFSLTHPTVIANLGDVYLNMVSSFKLRIVIFGNHRVLGARENMDKIRALLLAGTRASVLWRQAGGSRLQLVFCRDKMKAAAQKLLAEIQSTHS